MAIGKVIKNSGIYTVVSILQKGISFFLLPLYTAYLNPSDYGVLNIVTSVSSLLSIFILLGLDAAATRFYYYHPNDKEYIKKLWGSIVVCILIASAAFGAIFIVLHQFLVDPLVGNIPFYPYMILGICNTIVTPLYMFFQSCLQAQQNSVHYGINMLSCFVINTILIILFVAVWKKGVVGVLVANLITAIVYFIYVCVVFISKLKLNLSKEYVVSAYKYSLPLVPHLLAGWSTGVLDRLLINGLRGESDTGLFSIGKQFSNLLATLTNSVNMAFSPWLYESNNGKRYDDIRLVGSVAVLGYAIIAFSLSLFAPEILDLMVSEQFRGVWGVIPVLSFAMVMNGMYFLFVDVLFINKTQLVFIISVSALAMNVILNLLLIPSYGIMGSAWACFVTYFLKSMISLFLYKKNNSDIRYNWGFMYTITLSLFALSFINYPLSRIGLWPSLGLKSALTLILVSVLLLVFKGKVVLAWSKVSERKKHAKE